VARSSACFLCARGAFAFAFAHTRGYPIISTERSYLIVRHWRSTSVLFLSFAYVLQLQAHKEALVTSMALTIHAALYRLPTQARQRELYRDNISRN